MDTTRRVAVVTGGASGIGLEIVRHLLSEGLSVVAADRDKDACDAARKFLSDVDSDVKFVIADVSVPEGVRDVVLSVQDWGRIDILCNNAAFHPMQRIDEHDLEDWRQAFRVNVDAALMLSQAVLPSMKAQRAGTIINIGSISGNVPYAGGGAYAASKAALAMLTRVLAIEVGEFGITVNCIAPGAIRHGAHADVAPPPNIPIGRAGSPSEVAGLISYLASPAARYLTGSIIVLDGGATAGRVRKGGRKRSRKKLENEH